MNGYTAPSFNSVYFPIFYSPVKSLAPAFFEIKEAGKGIYTGESANLDLRFLALNTLSQICGLHDSYYRHLMMELGITLPNRLYHNSVNYGITSALQLFIEHNEPIQTVILFNENTRLTVQRSFKITNNNVSVPVLEAIVYKQNCELDLLPYEVAIHSIITCIIADLMDLVPGSLHFITSGFTNSISGIEITHPLKEQWIKEIEFPRLRSKFFVVDDLITEDPLESFTNLCETINIYLLEVCSHRAINPALTGYGNTIKSWNAFNPSCEFNGIIGKYLKNFHDWIKQGIFHFKPEFASEKTAG